MQEKHGRSLTIKEANINRGKMYFLTYSHCVHEVKMKRGESGGTYYSAGPRRSHRVNKLYTFHMGFDLLHNIEAAAHKIGVNLIRKGRY